MNGKKKLKIIATIEARSGSIRLPNKVLKKIEKKSLLEILIGRIKLSKKIDEIVIATTTNPNDLKIVELSKKLKVNYYRGSELNVLDRLAKATKKFNADIIIQLTGDNPLIDHEIIDYMIDFFLKNKGKYNYITNNGFGNLQKRKIPLGMDVQIFFQKDINFINNLKLIDVYKEHPSLFFYKNKKIKFKKKNIFIPKKWKRNYFVRLSVDTINDLKFIKIIYKKLHKLKPNFSLVDILFFLDTNKDLLNINNNVLQNFPDEKNIKKI